MRSEVSGCALSPDFAIKVICYGYIWRGRVDLAATPIATADRSGSSARLAPADTAGQMRQSSRRLIKD
jgi:hypothetical protein